jgi:hypothetical protein
MLATMLSIHASDGAAEATLSRRQCYRVMLVMALQLKVVLAVVRLCSPRAQSIEMLSHHEEVGYSCWLVAG